MRMSRKEFRHFQQSFHDWEVTLTRLLPRSLAVGDPDLSEDITHLLDSRSGIEETFANYPDDPKLFPYRLKMVTLDAELLLRRDDILRNWSLREYRGWRKRAHYPHTHWWWYLDEVREEAEVAR